MDDLIPEFIAETQEALSQLDEDMVRLEEVPDDPELLSSIFRVFHTIKGTCGFLNLSRLEHLAHDAENVLSKFREGELSITEDSITTILKCLDRIRSILDELETSGDEPEGDDTDLISQLSLIISGASVDTLPDKEPKGSDKEPENQGQNNHQNNQVSQDIKKPITSLEELLTQPVGTVSLADLDLDTMFEGREPTDAEMQAVFDAVEGYRPEAPTDTQEVSPTTPDTSESQHRNLQNNKQAKKPGKASGPVTVQDSMRVNLNVIESLMTLTSELILSRNQMLRLFANHHDANVTNALQRLNHVTGELQDAVMKTRMQPIRNAWAKMPRLVRDLSSELSKPIRLIMEGEETELDRQVLELIRDPLVHLVRNSADHGLESEQDRLARGKTAEGTIELNAHHEGGYLIVEVKDDGRGLSRSKLSELIIRKELATQSQLDTLSDQQVFQYILKPGFSTADKVTSVSGRGVGMDVVNTNMQQIGGMIELSSREGVGTTVRMKIPLTLAVISALIVKCANAVFALPQMNLLELVRLQADDKNLRHFGERMVLSLREDLLPVIRLEDLMQLERSTPRPDSELVMVLQIGSARFGVCVDAVLDTEEIVVKPSSGLLSTLTVYAGNTILGDGTVVMILDPAGLAELSGASTQDSADIANVEADQATTSNGERTDLIIFHGFTDKSIKAVPLGTLNRLELIDTEAIFNSGGQKVVRHNNTLLQVVPLSGEDIPSTGKYPALLFSDTTHMIAIIVREIEDVVTHSATIDFTSHQPGIHGSCLIDERPIEIIDTFHYFSHHLERHHHSHPEANPDRQHSEHIISSKRPKILLVDDSPFYLQMISTVLNAKGYETVRTASGEDALQRIKNGETFHAIMTDFDMPKMNGLELAISLRGLSQEINWPIFIVTNSVSNQLHAKSKAAGVNGVFAKFDHHNLLNKLQDFLPISA